MKGNAAGLDCRGGRGHPRRLRLVANNRRFLVLAEGARLRTWRHGYWNSPSPTYGTLGCPCLRRQTCLT